MINIIFYGFFFYPEASSIVSHYCFGNGSDLILNNNYLKRSQVIIHHLKEINTKLLSCNNITDKMINRLPSILDYYLYDVNILEITNKIEEYSQIVIMLTYLQTFYNQLHFFGRARINISRFFPKELKPVHFFPFLFFCYYVLTGLALLFFPSLGVLLFCGIIIYSLLVFFSAIINTKDYRIALLAIFAANIQLFAYGKGFAEEGWKKILNNTAA